MVVQAIEEDGSAPVTERVDVSPGLVMHKNGFAVDSIGNGCTTTVSLTVESQPKTSVTVK